MKTNKIYTVILYSGNLQHTAYAGYSAAAADKAVDTARNALVLGKGTATISRCEDGALKELTSVDAGMFTTESY